MKLITYNFTQDRCLWLAYQFNNREYSIAWDNAKYSGKPGLIWMDHKIEDSNRTRKDFDQKATYL